MVMNIYRTVADKMKFLYRAGEEGRTIKTNKKEDFLRMCKALGIKNVLIHRAEYKPDKAQITMYAYANRSMEEKPLISYENGICTKEILATEQNLPWDEMTDYALRDCLVELETDLKSTMHDDVKIIRDYIH